MSLPESAKYLIIGAGVHGLSTGWHLAQQLKQRGKGNGSDILIIDKKGVGAGASGIACGVIRNNYFQPAKPPGLPRDVAKWKKNRWTWKKRKSKTGPSGAWGGKRIL